MDIRSPRPSKLVIIIKMKNLRKRQYSIYNLIRESRNSIAIINNSFTVAKHQSSRDLLPLVISPVEKVHKFQLGLYNLRRTPSKKNRDKDYLNFPFDLQGENIRKIKMSFRNEREESKLNMESTGQLSADLQQNETPSPYRQYLAETRNFHLSPKSFYYKQKMVQPEQSQMMKQYKKNHEQWRKTKLKQLKIDNSAIDYRKEKVMLQNPKQMKPSYHQTYKSKLIIWRPEPLNEI